MTIRSKVGESLSSFQQRSIEMSTSRRFLDGTNNEELRSATHLDRPERAAYLARPREASMTTFVKTAALFCGAALLAVTARADSLPPDATYRPLPAQPLATVKATDEAQKPQVMQRQQALLEQRYDISESTDPEFDDVWAAKARAGRRPC
jgi:hypothetical protein